MARKGKEEVIDVEVTPTSPSEYFQMLKDSVETADKEVLKQLYENASLMAKKYMITGQSKGAEKLYKFATMTAKELNVLNYDIDKYLTRETITKYISEVSDKSVVLIEMKNYEREIPDDVVDKIMVLQENKVFDEYYILFTDYTGETRSKVAKEKRDKDPILLGALNVDGHLNKRLYYIASWEDEKCDLTLDKLVADFESKCKENPVKDIIKEYPTLDDFKRAFSGVDNE